MAELDDILNYRVVDDRISLSGQPTEAQIAALDDAGVVVNLGHYYNKVALADEPGAVAETGMAYHYLPVDFENPTERDYTCFCAVMSKFEGQRIHIHCIYNACVTAFMLRDARDGHGDIAEAEARIDGIWRPGGVWAAFLGHGQDTDKPNRYLGYDY